MSGPESSAPEPGKSSPTLADVIRQFSPDYLRDRKGRIPASHLAVLKAIAQCRTPVMGGHRYRCSECGFEHYVYHACRNRHCPQCQKLDQQKWLQARLKELLPIKYFHVTFTIPSSLHPIFLNFPKEAYSLLFKASSQTLIEFGKNNLGAKLGLIGLFHSWGQKLNFHPHIHYLVTCGGLSLDREEWVEGQPNFLFPKGALQKVFRAKLIAALDRAPWLDDSWKPSILKAKAKTWSVDIRRPRGDPRRLLLYLARYTYRVAIDDQRILAIDRDQQRVLIRYKNYSKDGALQTLWLPAVEFIRRFLMHVLPKGFVKVRYYGLFAHAHRKDILECCRQKLQAQGLITHPTLWSLQALLATIEIPAPSIRCPRCKRGILELIGVIPPRYTDHPEKPP